MVKRMRLIDADELIIMQLHDENDTPIGPRFVPAELIEDAPTVEAEPVKHGRWEESWGGKWHSCSICGGIPPFNMMGDDMPTPYCPHCGAKMDLDEVEE